MASGKPPKKRKIKSKLSEMVLHRRRDADALVSSIEAFKEPVLEGIAKRYGALLEEGESLPDFDLALDLIIREVRTAIDRLCKLDHQHAWHKAKGEQLRHDRDRLVTEACSRLVPVRGSIDASLGREAGRRLHGLKGKTPRRMPRLGQALDHLVEWLENPEMPLPRSGRSVLPIDREVWLAPLREPRKGLADNDKAMRKTSHLEQKLRIQKGRAMNAFDEVHAHCLRDLKAMMLKAGLDPDLVKHLRPIQQRRRHHQRARQKREHRAAAKEAAAASAASEPPAPVDEAKGEAGKSAGAAGRDALRAAVAKWLRKRQRPGHGSA